MIETARQSAKYDMHFVEFERAEKSKPYYVHASKISASLCRENPGIKRKLYGKMQSSIVLPAMAHSAVVPRQDMTIAQVIENQNLKRQPFCDAASAVFEAVVTMTLLDVTALAVLSDDSLVGIITDRDALLCMADCGSEFFEQSVEDWMSERPVTCNSATKLSAALNLMGKHGIRNLVVKQNERPKTVVSIKEILTRVHQEDALELKILRERVDEH